MFASHSFPKNRSNRHPRRLQLENLEGRQLMVADGFEFGGGVMSAAHSGVSSDAPALITTSLESHAQKHASPFVMDPQPQTGEGIYPAVGYLNTGTICTGTLINSQHVLTAAHCTSGRVAAQSSFYVGGAWRPVSQLFTHPNYAGEQYLGNDWSHDIAVVRLAQPVTNVTPIPISRTVPQTGWSMTLVGYGNTGTGQTGEQLNTLGVKRFGYTPIERVTAALVHWTFNVGESSTMHGDSGGPALVNFGGQDRVVGVTSGGSPAANAPLVWVNGRQEQLWGTYGAPSFDTRVDAYANWIDGIVSPSVTVAAPQLIGPTGTVTTTQPTLRWNAVSGAARYHVWVEDANRNVVVNTEIAQAAYTPTLVNGRQYQFWVAAIASNGTRSPWSNSLTFTVQQPAASSAPTILTPSGTQTTRRPTFSWTPVTGAARYHLYVDNLSTAQRGVVNLYVSGASIRLNVSLPAGHNYRMWVAAINANGTYGPWSPQRDFGISANATYFSAEPNDGPCEANPVDSPLRPPLDIAPPTDDRVAPANPKREAVARLRATVRRDSGRTLRSIPAVDALVRNLDWLGMRPN
jgi:hypothetical protein